MRIYPVANNSAFWYLFFNRGCGFHVKAASRRTPRKKTHGPAGMPRYACLGGGFGAEHSLEAGAYELDSYQALAVWLGGAYVHYATLGFEILL